MRYLLLLLLAGLAACQSETTEPTAAESSEPAEAAADMAPEPALLAALLDAQPDEVKARYEFRNPEQTLEFFGIEPGMTVLEGLPGRGWYTKILMQYLRARRLTGSWLVHEDPDAVPSCSKAYRVVAGTRRS